MLKNQKQILTIKKLKQKLIFETNCEKLQKNQNLKKMLNIKKINVETNFERLKI